MHALIDDPFGVNVCDGGLRSLNLNLEMCSLFPRMLRNISEATVIIKEIQEPSDGM